MEKPFSVIVNVAMVVEVDAESDGQAEEKATEIVSRIAGLQPASGAYIYIDDINVAEVTPLKEE